MEKNEKTVIRGKSLEGTIKALAGLSARISAEKHPILAGKVQEALEAARQEFRTKVEGLLG